MINLERIFRRIDPGIITLISAFLSFLLLFIPLIVPPSVDGEHQRLIYASTFSLISIFSNFGKEYLFAVVIVITTATLAVFQLFSLKLHRSKAKFSMMLMLLNFLFFVALLHLIINKNIHFTAVFTVYYVLLFGYQLFANMCSIFCAGKTDHFQRKEHNFIFITIFTLISILLSAFFILFIVLQMPHLSAFEAFPSSICFVLLVVFLIASIRNKIVSPYLGPIQIANSFFLLIIGRAYTCRFYVVNEKLLLILIPVFCFVSGVLSLRSKNVEKGSKTTFGSKMLSISVIASLIPVALPFYMSVSSITIPRWDESMAIPFVPALSIFKSDCSYFYGKTFTILYPVLFFFFSILILWTLYSVKRNSVFLIIGSIFSCLSLCFIFVSALIDGVTINVSSLILGGIVYLALSVILLLPNLVKKYDYEWLSYTSLKKWIIWSGALLLGVVLEVSVVDFFSLWSHGAGYYTIPIFILTVLISFYFAKEDSIFDAIFLMFIGVSACLFFKGTLSLDRYGNLDSLYNIATLTLISVLAIISFILQSRFKKRGR